MTAPYLQPRIIRASQAPSYLGMCRAEFDKTVRPYVREFPIGKQGVGFDREDLDSWADAYIATHSIDKKVSPHDRVRYKQTVSEKRPEANLRKSITKQAVNPHEKSKDEFQKTLEMVKGIKRP